METQRLLPLESDDREQRCRLWSQIPEQDRSEFIMRCALLIARAARVVASPQQEEARHDASER
jgi:hypothetical protein